MNNVSEQLLQAMDIIMDEKLTLLSYDKTILATIYAIVDLDTGEYKVRYNGNIFTVYASDTSKTYKLDEAVYVLVPEGNFSSKKLITAKVSSDSLSDNEITNLANLITEVSPTFDNLYGYDASISVGVTAGVKPGEPRSEEYICLYPSPLDPIDKENFPHRHTVFQLYANNYEYIRVKASFLTRFYSAHSQGNYGLEIEFYTKESTAEEPVSVKYRLDVLNFNGDPYSFSVYSPQEIILKVQKNYLIGLKSIKLFEENFVYDLTIAFDGTPTKLITDVANIFVKDIVVQYVDKKDLSAITYYLAISTPKGIVFTKNITSLNLVGKLIYQGSDIMSTKNCTCQWYERDLSIMAGEESYDKTAGFGWKPLEDLTSSTLTLDDDDVYCRLKYKLVVVYNDKTTLTAETELWNYRDGHQYDYSLEQATEGADIKLLLKNNSTDEQLQGNWYLSYPDNSYNSVLEGKNLSEISISSYLQYSYVTFYCAVYNFTGQYLGTLEHTVMNSEDESDVTISYNGEDSFRYDANGDVTIEDSEQDRTLEMNLTWKEGYGTSYTVTWLLGNQEIPVGDKNQAYSPSDSMMLNIWVDNNDILHYNIKLKYKVNNNNNIITIKIKTITESIYIFNKEIIFLKDGDLGTNGTTYIIAIRPCDSNGTKVSGFLAIRYNGSWLDSLRLRCYVYKDGELINNNSKHTITYNWNCHNLIGESKEYTDRVIVSGLQAISASSDSNLLDTYAKVSVTIDGEINLYALYPVNVVLGTAAIKDINIDDIPSYIKYNSSGLVPSFYSNEINFYYQGQSYNSNIESANTDLLTIVDRDNKRYLEPVDSFIFENIENNSESNIAVLKCQIDIDNWIIHPIVMYLDTYGNEAINGWDGTTLDTGNGNYVFAPLVGAGKKESNNTFTGVVMGKDSGQQKIGLYGYQKGINTFGFKEDGTAFIGPMSGGGLITFDGNNAIIQGGGGGSDSSGNGMTITLANLKKDDGTYNNSADAIKVGNGDFKVTYDGTIYAVKGIIGGNGNNSNGWQIEEGKLYSNRNNSSKYIELNSQAPNDKDPNTEYFIIAGSKTPTNANFSVKKDGTMKATSGTIGGWSITSLELSYNSGQVGMAIRGRTFNNENASFWAGNGNFYVTPNGKLYCSKAEIHGDIYCSGGTIGGWEISSNYLSNGDTVLSSDNGVTTNSITVSDRGYTGTIGIIRGNNGNYGVGITSNDRIIIESEDPIRIEAPQVYLTDSDSNSSLYIWKGNLICTFDKENLSGIYARFA